VIGEGGTEVNKTKAKIIDTAIELFSLKGFSAVSVRDITREVGIKESSMYNHFRSKDELLETIFHLFRMETAKIMPPMDSLDRILADMSPEAFLKRGFQNFKEHIGDPAMEKIWRIMYMEQYRNALARDIYLHDIVGRTIDFLEIVFAKYIAMKRVKPFDPRILAVNYQYPLFTIIPQYIMLRLDQKETGDLEKSITGHIEFFIRLVTEESE
jgi:AcrR family transcriptional regulator